MRGFGWLTGCGFAVRVNGDGTGVEESVKDSSGGSTKEFEELLRYIESMKKEGGMKSHGSMSSSSRS